MSRTVVQTCTSRSWVSLCALQGSKEDPGVYVRTLNELFEVQQRTKGTKDYSFQVGTETTLQSPHKNFVYVFHSLKPI